MSIVFNWTKITGNNNIVFQGADGATRTTTVDQLVNAAIEPLNDKIFLLENSLLDKTKIINFSESELDRLRKELEQVHQERETLLAKLENFVSIAADNGFENLSSIVQSALNLLLEGKIEDALEAFNGLDADAERFLAQREKLNKVELEIYSNYLFKSTLLYVQGDLGGVKKNIENALKVHMSFKSLIDASQMYSLLDEPKLSSTHLDLALGRAVTKQELVLVLLMKAHRLREEHSYPEAEIVLIQCDALLSDMPMDLEREELSLQINTALTEIYQLLGDSSKVESKLQLAISSSAVLLEAERERYLPYIARFNHTASLYYVQIHDMNNGLAHLVTSLALYTEAFQMTGMFVEHVVELNNELGILYRKRNMHGEAFQHYSSALNVLGNIKAPIKKKELEASILNNLSSLYIIAGDGAQAEKVLKSALALRRELADADPKTGRKYLADTLINYANHLTKKGLYDDAIDALNESLNIYSEYELNSPGYFTGTLASVNHNLGMAYRLAERYSDAIAPLNSAISVRKNLVNEGEKRLNSVLAGSLVIIAGVKANLGELVGAEADYEKSVAVQQIALENNLDTDRLQMAKIKVAFAEFYQLHVPNKDKSLELIEEAMKVSWNVQETNFEFQQVQGIAEKIVKDWSISWDELLRKVALVL